MPESPAFVRADIDARLTGELAAVVSGARRRAHRDGDKQVDTAHLLHSLLESDTEAQESLAGSAQVARVLGYLVQRSIGYGLRWQGSVEDSGTLPVVEGSGRQGTAGRWSPSVVTALERAVGRAALRGDRLARGVDLLAGIAADTECRATEVLERAGVDVRALAARLAVVP